MSGSFFAQSWHRVAGLRPRLLQHVRAERRRYGRQAWYALHDPLAGRVHLVTPAAYLFVARMDGRRTVDEIWQSVAADMDEDAPGQGAAIQLLTQLHEADLLAGDVPPDAAELFSRRTRLSRPAWRRNLRSPLSMQIPLFDPDGLLTRALPLAAPLMTRAGAACWLALVAAGALAAARGWDELRETFADRAAGEGLLALALVYPAMKALHELGHGLAAKRLGCEVRETGVMLLALLPAPYVDVGASAALPGKWARAGVAAAGVIVELGLAAAAALVWEAAEPGLLREAAFDVMVVGGASSLLVNGNPLLRFDGYHVLSDVLEVPNLASRADRYLGHLVRRHAFGLPGMRDFAAGARERCVMLAYAPLAWGCRMLMLAGVSLFAASQYGTAGVAAAAAAVTAALLRPAARALWLVAAGPACRARRGRAAGLTFGALAAGAALLLAVPAPLHGVAEGVIWLPEEAIVRAGADGFVRAVQAAPGATVAAGDALMTLDHPVAEAGLRVAAARVAALEARRAAEWVDDRAAAGVTGFELAQARASLARDQELVSQQTVTARAAGVFSAARPASDMPGRFVRQGEVVGYVTPEQGAVARIVVPQADIGLVRDRLASVTVRLADRRTEFASRLSRAVPAARDELPNPALSSANGGAAASRDRKDARASERMFQFDVVLPPGSDVAAAGFGSRVHVRLDYAWEPLGRTIWRRVRQVLLSRFDA